MSALTAEGRKKIRDIQRERMNQRLRKDPELGGIPAHRLDTLSELKLVAGISMRTSSSAGLSCRLERLTPRWRRTERMHMNNYAFSPLWLS
jgi:hypothetical protein